MKEDDLPFDLAKTIACMRAAGTDQSCEVKSAVGKPLKTSPNPSPPFQTVREAPSC